MSRQIRSRKQLSVLACPLVPVSISVDLAAYKNRKNIAFQRCSVSTDDVASVLSSKYFCCSFYKSSNRAGSRCGFHSVAIERWNTLVLGSKVDLHGWIRVQKTSRCWTFLTSAIRRLNSGATGLSLGWADSASESDFRGEKHSRGFGFSPKLSLSSARVGQFALRWLGTPTSVVLRYTGSLHRRLSPSKRPACTVPGTLGTGSIRRHASTYYWPGTQAQSESLKRNVLASNFT